MQPQGLHFRSLLTIGFIALLAAGCSSPTGEAEDATAPVDTEEATTADSATPDPETDGDSSEGTGDGGESVFTIGETIYSAELEFCALREEQDALFHGPVYDESGNEVGYLDGDFAIDGGDALGEARINFGVSEQFETSDEFLAIGESVGAMVFTGFSDTEWFVIGTAWDQDGTQTPSARLSVTC